MFTYETDARLKGMADAAVKSEVTTGYPPVAMLAQFAAESGWGESVTGAFNFWGIKRYPQAGPAKFCATTEDLTTAGFEQLRADERASVTAVEDIGIPGVRRYHLSCWFASYASFDESVKAYIEFILTNSRYHPAWTQYQLTEDPYAFLQGIAAAGYATSPGYAKLLMEIAQQDNIQHAVAMARANLAPKLAT